MEFLEIPLYDDDIYKLCVRFLFNLFFLAIIVAFAIYPTQKDREFAFTAVMMNVTVFFICFTLKKFELGLGMALGLFAIFGVLRYRTDAIRAKEMTYLFIVIGLAVINSLSNKKTSYGELVAVNGFIICTALLKEKIVARGNKNAQAVKETKTGTTSAKPRKHTVDYDRLDLLASSKYDELLDDLKNRTGNDFSKVQVQNIDLPNSRATLTVWYNDSPPTTELPEGS